MEVNFHPFVFFLSILLQFSLELLKKKSKNEIGKEKGNNDDKSKANDDDKFKVNDGNYGYYENDVNVVVVVAVANNIKFLLKFMIFFPYFESSYG